MRFSTIAAVSAIVLGVNAVANPDVVVYETQVVTITSCPPEKPACPASSTSYIPVTTPAPTTEAPAVTPTPDAPVDETPEEPAVPETPEEPAVPETPEEPAVPEVPEVPEVPKTEEPETETETPVTPVVPVAPISTGTGTPSAPGNGSTPAVPVSPPVEEFEGAGSKMGVSILAIAGAAVFALLA